MVCFDTAENFYIWAMRRYALFPDFTQLLMAFFQNLLANVITLTNIARELFSTLQDNRVPQTFNLFGRIFKILIDF